jgi:hypothetical protein
VLGHLVAARFNIYMKMLVQGLSLRTSCSKTKLESLIITADIKLQIIRRTDMKMLVQGLSLNSWSCTKLESLIFTADISRTDTKILVQGLSLKDLLLQSSQMMISV